MVDANTTLGENSVAVSAETAAGKRTGYRWVILFMCGLLAFILNIDRSNISVAAPLIMKQYGFTKTEMGLVFSAFSTAYAIGQIPGGWFADTIGARKVLTLVVFFWSVMTMATGHAWGLVSMLAIRFIFGLGEASCYPAMTRAMEFWYPKSERGIANGVSHSGSMLGIAVVPPVAVLIMTAWGWPSVFYIFGAVGVVWAIFWWFMYREHPEEHRRVSDAEAAYIRSGLRASAREAKKKVKVPWGQILSSRNMWAIAIAYSAWAYGGYFFWFWMPTYMLERQHISLKAMGYLAPLPLIAGALGIVVGGAITDLVYKKTGNLKLSRSIVGVGGMALAAAFMIPVPFVSSPALMVICMALCNFGNSSVVPVSFAVCIDVSGGFSGSVSGVMNTVGMAAGSVSAILFGVMSQRGSWTAPFFITSGIMVVACILWAFAIDPAKAVVVKSLPLSRDFV